jgi:hypothetical protein
MTDVFETFRRMDDIMGKELMRVVENKIREEEALANNKKLRGA